CRTSRKATPSGQMTVDRDTVSLILFDNTAITAFENETSEIINTYYDASNRTSIIIFLSDGEYHAPESELHSLCEREGSPIFLYTIMFTGGTRHTYYGQLLQRMADIASEYLRQTTKTR
ncbi:4202_t:CDS:2, partial [Funneliformis geosporum]